MNLLEIITDNALTPEVNDNLEFMRVKIESTTHGSYTIQRNERGFSITETQSGISIATVDTYAEAVKCANQSDRQKAIVKLFGKEKALEIIRKGL